jgi:peptidoglycan/LPS O-acetylase OafA/YrhL
VITWHYLGATLQVGPRTLASSIRNVWGPIGLSGVDLFFVLSGFLIGGILQDRRKSKHYYSTFYKRRICRIFPVYYITIGTVLVSLALSLPRRFPAISEWLMKDLMPLATYLSFTQNFWMSKARHAGGKWLAMTWSVAVEEQFYLLCPPLVRQLSNIWLPVLVLLGLAAAPVFRQLAEAHSYWYYTLLPCRCDGLGIGVLAAWLVRQTEALAFLNRQIHLMYLVLLGSLIASLSIGDFRFHYSAVALFYGVLILIVVVHPHSFLAALFRIRSLRAIGLISYGVYMYHQPIIGMIFAIARSGAPVLGAFSDLLLVIGAFVLTISIATLSYRLMEMRVIELGHRAKW